MFSRLVRNPAGNSDVGREFSRHRRAGARWVALCGLLLAQTLSAQPLRLAVLGDSLSAEYDSITGIAGIDDPTEYAAITHPGWESMSWVEVVGRLRSSTVDLGSFKGAFPGWTDLLFPVDFRFTGYEYNVAIPGFTAAQFRQIVHSSLLSDPQFLPYKDLIRSILQDHADAAVVWLGGNEWRANYGFLYDGNDPTSLIDNLTNDLRTILDFVRDQKPEIKLVLVNLPDLGATPNNQTSHPDPLKRANATAATILANQAITNLAASRGIPIADMFSETYKIVAGETVWIGPVNLYPGNNPDNDPRYQFTRDGLHPNTCLQAIITRRIVDALNRGYSTGIPQITDGEILNLIGINPLQPYWDWVTANAPLSGGMGEDPDHDELVNLAEFVFGLNPGVSSPPPLTIASSVSPISMRYRPDPDRLRLVEVRPDWSTNLLSWQPVPAPHLTTAPDGTVTVSLPSGEASRFVRLQISVRAVN